MPEHDVTVIDVKTIKTVGDSKLYALTKAEPLLPFLIPDLATQMATEVSIDESFPREESDDDATRILINYTNLKGTPVLYKILDHQRLNLPFDIDDFMNGHMKSLQEGSDVLMTEGDMGKAVTTVLNTALTTTMGLSDNPDVSQKDRAKTKAVAEIVLKSLVAAIFDDALDVIIILNEQAPRENETESSSLVVGMWAVKLRPGIDVDDSDTLEQYMLDPNNPEHQPIIDEALNRLANETKDVKDPE